MCFPSVPIKSPWLLLFYASRSYYLSTVYGISWIGTTMGDSRVLFIFRPQRWCTLIKVRELAASSSCSWHDWFMLIVLSTMQPVNRQTHLFTRCRLRLQPFPIWSQWVPRVLSYTSYALFAPCLILCSSESVFLPVLLYYFISAWCCSHPLLNINISHVSQVCNCR